MQTGKHKADSVDIKKEILRYGPVSTSVTTKDNVSLANSNNVKFNKASKKPSFSSYKNGILKQDLVPDRKHKTENSKDEDEIENVIIPDQGEILDT